VTGTPPFGFFASLAGATVGGGVVLAGVHRMLRRASLRSRLRAAPGDDRASTIVEFPFALITLLIITLLTWQLAMMASAYLLVDYAAYCAARCAIVTIPEDRSSDDDEEGVNKIKDATSSPKRDDIKDAAMIACYPIAGFGSVGGGDIGTDIWRTAIDAIATVLPVEGVAVEVERYAYLKEHTKVTFMEDVEPEDRPYAAGDLVHVKVEHRYQLRVPFANRIFGTSDDAWGYGTGLVGEATMLVEAYPDTPPP
jgi:hypothetical protein